MALAKHFTGFIRGNSLLCTVTQRCFSTGGWSAQKHVVAVGAGYAGIKAALDLQKAGIPYTLINPRDCFHHNLGALRAVCEPGYVKTTMIPLEPTFGSNLKKGKVVDVLADARKVLLDSGEEVSYDYLVLATGSGGPFPVKYDPTVDMVKAKLQYNDMLHKIKSSQKVLVIGGGATGAELAAEIAHTYPKKQVTLLHNSKRLIHQDFSDKFQTKIKAQLDSLRINTILDELVDINTVPDEGAVNLTTDKGTKIEADIVFKTIGLPVQTDAYRNTLGNVMEKNGQLKVDQYLRVEGHPDIYAVGDCCNTKDIKLGFTAGMQAGHAVSNIKSKINGKAEKAWSPGQIPIIAAVALGPNKGIGQLKNGLILGEFMVKRIKSRNLLAPMYWKQMGQKMPK